ncbi:MAG: type I restriction enzyme HsdR N-terminal domain-containing protein [Bacteroidota bacterium]|nr:type I restriction enzyme HsdR N-terminal domain-containing protein [Bacteroidota bacterium]
MKAELGTLALPDHGLKTKQGALGTEVFDRIRGRWILATPEEWVRQHFIDHLVHDRGCPASLIAVEKALVLNDLAKRADIVVHGFDGQPVALIECKAPSVRIDQATLEQAARYNIVFRVKFLLVTNGHRHYCFAIDHEKGTARSLDHIPDHQEMIAR